MSSTVMTAPATPSSTLCGRVIAPNKRPTAGPRSSPFYASISPPDAAPTLVRKIMCSYIVEKTRLSGSAKGPNGWMHIDNANVYFDHPYHAPFDHALAIDFTCEADGGTERVAVELSALSARALVDAILAALASGEAEIKVFGRRQGGIVAAMGRGRRPARMPATPVACLSRS